MGVKSQRIALPNVEGARVIVHGRHGEMVVSSSAYDVPRYVDVKVSDSENRLWITFGYIDSEEAERRDLDPNFTVLVGVNSGKLLGLEARNLSRSTGEVVISLVKAVDQQLEHATRDNQKLNYGMIRNVVKDRVAPLLAGA
jgi:hypothetical protein